MTATAPQSIQRITARQHPPVEATTVTRGQRADAGGETTERALGADEAFRDDLERIRFSPYYSRLGAVTQVISSNGAGQGVHNRLTHTIKVTSVARAIATGITRPGDPRRDLLDRLGGCDPVVVQAAASAHDLGHPPFGHLGESVLNRIARQRYGLEDGFDGNAQTFRILTTLDALHPEGGLNLTAAVRAAVLKYPWCRVRFPRPHPSEFAYPPRGAGAGDDDGGSSKFSAYFLDAAEMVDARAAYPGLPALRQTVECSVMDVADDIAYSLHDLDDFHRAGVLQYAAVATEFREWRAHAARLARQDLDTLTPDAPGRSLEALRRRIHAKDPWIADDDAFFAAADRVRTDLIDGLLAVPYDGSRAAERALGAFTGQWLARLQDAVTVTLDPHPRSGYVSLLPQAWHEVTILKFVHQRFVLQRPDLALYQRGQARILLRLVDGFDAWLADRADAARAPRRLLEFIDLATMGYDTIAGDSPDLLAGADPAARRRRAVGRGLIDYIASLSDARAAATADSITGRAERLWDAGGGL
ncbi:deoxyguanosinetriphosphate triphosphohydrolase family protein [Rugosimonospora africana]|uniref:dGTPase n=1 Tax=Rugosimonospora africana TaxID=556532 RepID=A0A8J3QSB6_9ACTN|nr:dNTP triphosphohydrolase [Rugosimonospora africana]GIH15814.1 dGTPase [Rugosimonospora africana]